MVKLQDGYRILFIGDSITDIKFNKKQNKNLGGKNIYALQVTKELKKKYKNLKFFYRGIASNRSYHLYDRLTKDCISLKPDVIVMLIVVNDAWENYKPEDFPPLLRPFEPHMSEVYRRIKMELPKAKLITMLPFLIDTIPEKTPFHSLLEEYYVTIRNMADGVASEIIDLQTVFDKAQETTNPYDLSHDGVHPTELGHSLIANEVLKVLN